MRRDSWDAVRAELTREYGDAEILLLGSGTQALQVALQEALRRVGGGGLAIPAYSCFDVASAAVWVGAPLHPYDVDPETLSPDMEGLESALEQGASVVLVSPLYGLPVACGPLMEITASYGALLVLDAAQSFGVRWGGRPLSAQADIAVLSFAKGKGWTAGEGGAVLSKGEIQADSNLPDPPLSREITVVMGAAAQWILGRPDLYGIPGRLPWLGLGETRYHPPVSPGRMTRVAASIASVTYRAAVDEARDRAVRARKLLARLPRSAGIRPIGLHQDPGAAFLRLPVLTSRGMTGFPSESLARSLGVMPGYPMPLPHLEALSAQIRSVGPWRGAETLSRGLVTFPTHSRLNDRDIDGLVALASSYGADA